MNLWKSRTTLAGKLSGGQKRRLALAIALVGDPKIVVLDEPTAGVDAAGKVEIRNIIRRLKRSNRIIILTTHVMEEAEYLADYTAILAAGNIEVEGSVLALKQKYGVGYYLKVRGELAHTRERPAKTEPGTKRKIDRDRDRERERAREITSHTWTSPRTLCTNTCHSPRSSSPL